MSAARSDQLTDPWGDYETQEGRVLLTVMPEGRWWIVESGYLASEDPRIHALSKKILRWALVGTIYVVIIKAAFVVDAAATGRSLSEEALDASLNVIVSIFLFYALVRAIETRNAPWIRCKGLDLGGLELFQIWHILLAIYFAGYALVIGLGVDDDPLGLKKGDRTVFGDIVWFAVAALFVACVISTVIADATRRLLRVLPDKPPPRRRRGFGSSGTRGVLSSSASSGSSGIQWTAAANFDNGTVVVEEL